MTSKYNEPLSLDLGWDETRLGRGQEDSATIAGMVQEDVPETVWSDAPDNPDARLDFWRSIMDRRIYHEPPTSKPVSAWMQSMPDEQRLAYDSWTRRMASERQTPSQLSTRSARNKRYESSHKAQRVALNAARYADKT
jgi:hypothetical protein